MAHQIDYLPVAAAPGSNVDTQAAFTGSGYQVNGFQNGLAIPSQVNKIVRQSSMMSAALANIISVALNIDVLDDGNINNLTTNLQNALRAASNKIVQIAYAAAPQIDASQGNKFEMTLAGPMAPTLINYVAGQSLTFIIHQDVTGGRVFTPPANLPMGDISTNPSDTTIQKFDVDSAGIIRPTTAPTVS